jgi:hypothetical protein
VPVEQLLRSSVRVSQIVITGVIIIAAVAFIGTAGFLIYKKQAEKPSVPVAERQPVEYSLTENTLEKRFYGGDTLIIPLSGVDYTITLQNISDIVTLGTPGKDVRLDLNNEALLDTNNDGITELRVSAIDYAQNRFDMGALLRFDLISDAAVPRAPGDEALANTPADGPASGAASAGGAAFTVFADANPYPITLQVSFQGYCMFRWEILREANRQNRNERYFVRGDELNIQAQNGVRIWVSNSSAIKIRAIGGGHNVPLDFGSGEVIVEDIYWARDDDGRYKLLQTRLES